MIEIRLHMGRLSSVELRRQVRPSRRAKELPVCTLARIKQGNSPKWDYQITRVEQGVRSNCIVYKQTKRNVPPPLIKSMR